MTQAPRARQTRAIQKRSLVRRPPPWGSRCCAHIVIGRWFVGVFATSDSCTCQNMPAVHRTKGKGYGMCHWDYTWLNICRCSRQNGLEKRKAGPAMPKDHTPACATRHEDLLPTLCFPLQHCDLHVCPAERLQAVSSGSCQPAACSTRMLHPTCIKLEPPNACSGMWFTRGLHPMLCKPSHAAHHATKPAYPAATFSCEYGCREACSSSPNNCDVWLICMLAAR